MNEVPRLAAAVLAVPASRPLDRRIPRRRARGRAVGVAVWWLAAILPGGAGVLQAQDAPVPDVLGIPAPTSIESGAAAPPPAVSDAPSAEVLGIPTAPPVGRGTGRSGSLRMLLSAPAAELDSTALAPFGAGWGRGHRWTPLHETTAPQLLGEPRPTDLDFSLGSVVTPAEFGTWLLENPAGDSLMVVTRVPASSQSGGTLNGYRIGVYPTAGSQRDDEYRPPEAFIEVTPGTTALPVSDHLILGQFLTKDQFEVWPKYLALDLRLIDKLELVVQELNAMGVRADRMHVMSGFRTPQYNGPGGDGRASLSRHMWGDAADVWIDNDADGMMDDLNGDLRIDLDDAAVMMRAVERVERKHPELIGGAGTYPTTPTHGPYIHIDARGNRARW